MVQIRNDLHILLHTAGNTYAYIGGKHGILFKCHAKAIVFYFLFYRFFSQQVRVRGRNINKNKIHLDHFQIELKPKETQNIAKGIYNVINNVMTTRVLTILAGKSNFMTTSVTTMHFSLN